MSKEDQNSNKTDQSENAHSMNDKIFNAFTIIGMAGGSVIATGVVLQTFLRVPITNVTAHVSAGVVSAIAGAGFGIYLNHVDSQASRK